MKCYNCKSQIPDGTVVCPKCGTSLVIDQPLIDRAKAGDQDAIADLYNRTYNPVYNTIRFILNDEDEVLDVLQDSYIKAFGSLDQLQEANKFEAWIKRIAHNRAIDLLRKARPMNFSDMVSEDSDEVLEFEDDRPDSLPDVVIDQKETARLLGEILDSLPDDQRVCVTMFYYDQLSVKEIAEELGVAEATVKSRLNYGRKKIESKVRDLEKKGTKLYGIAPIPFLLLLLRQELEISEVSASGVLGSVLEALSGEAGAVGGTAASTAATEVSAKTAASAASAAGKGAAVAAGAAKMTLGTKIIAGVLALALIGGGGAAISKAMNKAPAEPVPAAEPAPEPPAPPEEPSASSEQEGITEEELKANVDAVYDKVLGEYANLMDMGRDAFLEKYGSTFVDYPSGGINYMLPFDAFQGEGEVLWGRYDYNGDGIDELVLALDGGDYRQVYAVYASDGENFYELADDQHLGYRINLNVLPDGTFMIHGSGGANTWSDTICKISENGKSLDIIEKYIYDEMSTGSTSYVGENEILTADVFDEKYGSKAVDATKYGDIKFHLLASTWKSEEEPESEVKQTDASAYNDAFEQIRFGYEMCMAEDPRGDEYLEYRGVEWTVENKQDVGGVAYALYDINSDGIPEMIMGYPEFYWPDIDYNSWFFPFEIYAFDGEKAVPLCKDLVDQYGLHNIHIGKNGSIILTEGNGGISSQAYCELSQHGSSLKVTDFYDSINYPNGPEFNFDHYVNGEKLETISYNQLWDIFPETVKLTYNSILTSVYSTE